MLFPFALLNEKMLNEATEAFYNDGKGIFSFL